MFVVRGEVYVCDRKLTRIAIYHVSLLLGHVYCILTDANNGYEGLKDLHNVMINASMQVASPDKNIQVKVTYAVCFHQDRLVRINTCGMYSGVNTIKGQTIKVNTIKRWSKKPKALKIIIVKLHVFIYQLISSWDFALQG